MYDVFVSYRHQDGLDARLLMDCLDENFSAFIDLKTARGLDFTADIVRYLGGARVFIAIIGNSWASPDNLARLADKNDWVRREIEMAVGRPDMRILPLFLNDQTPLPVTETLPPPIQALLQRKGDIMRHGTWESDVERLVKTIGGWLGSGGMPAQRSIVPPDLPFLCDRVEQEDSLERLIVPSRATRTLFCVVHGHKFEAHSGFLSRVCQLRVLEELFDVGNASFTEHTLEWNASLAEAGEHDELLKSAIRKGVMQKRGADDAALVAFLRNPLRPLVMSLQVTWSDILTHGQELVGKLEAAWTRLVAQVGLPAHPLILWLNLTYDEEGTELKDAQRLPRLGPATAGHIQTWMARDEVKRFVEGQEIQFLNLANDPKYALAPGNRLHMQHFVDAARALTRAK